jgi:hypothetical protein
LFWSAIRCTAPIRERNHDGTQVSLTDDWHGGGVNSHHGLGVDVGAAMSHYCGEHPRYEAKREPKGICPRCWSLYFYRHPEAKEVLQREYREAEELKVDL